MYVNNTPYCSSVHIEHHRGPCHCQCLRTSSSCQARQQFLPGSCSCQCLPGLAREKSVCSNSSVHMWDSDSCQCKCKHSTTCQQGEQVNTNTCQCQQQQQVCEQGGNLYLVNLIFLLLILTMITLITICWIRNTKKRVSTRYYPDNIYHHTTSESEISADENLQINSFIITKSTSYNLSKVPIQQI